MLLFRVETTAGVNLPMTEKVSTLAKAFAGYWRIVDMDVWGKDVIDVGEEAHLCFKGASEGEIAFVAVKGLLDVRYGTRDGVACAEFSWQGYDEGDEVCGRGWAMLDVDGRLVGHIFIHQSDDSAFICQRTRTR
jgi:hypothetical protein